MTDKREVAPKLVWTGPERPRIPAGEYTARCTNFQGPEWIFEYGRWGLRLEFTLDPDEQCVSAFYALGEDPSTPKFGARSKYYKDWVRTNGGPPKTGQEMSPEIFLDEDLGYTVSVSDSKKDGEKKQKDAALVYSRIDKLLRVNHLSR